MNKRAQELIDDLRTARQSARELAGSIRDIEERLERLCGDLPPDEEPKPIDLPQIGERP